MSLNHHAAVVVASLMLTFASACSNGEANSEQDELEEVRDAATGKDASNVRDATTPDASHNRDRDGGGADDASAPKPPTDAGARADSATPSPSDAGSTPDAAVQQDAGPLANFSFFVTSLDALRRLSKNQNGFGGDLRFGETGDGAGLRGADKICTTIAETSMPGSGSKVWHAFLSAGKAGPNGAPVHAIDRVGVGPWYDREGRLVAMTKSDLTQMRPASANAMIKNDLPNEDGVPNHAPEGAQVDNHHVLTGSDESGRLYATDGAVTCDDWTKSAADVNDAPRCGLSWPRAFGFGDAASEHWISAIDEAGCAPGVGIVEMGPPDEAGTSVGSGGGYGAIYCFALAP